VSFISSYYRIFAGISQRSIAVDAESRSDSTNSMAVWIPVVILAKTAIIIGLQVYFKCIKCTKYHNRSVLSRCYFWSPALA